MVITKGRIYTFTVIAFLLYIFLEFIVDDYPFYPLFSGGAPEEAELAFFGDNFWKTLDGSWIRWLALIAIPLLGIWQANQLGDREVDITPTYSEGAPGQVDDPSFWKAFTGNTWLAVLWLPLRFVLGIHWLQAGWHKIFDAGWGTSGTVIRNGEEVVMNRGDSMKGFLMGAYTPNEETGAVRAAFGWYADFLKWMVDNDVTSWMGPVVAWGEALIGIGLIVGGLVGIAAFFGTLLNMTFLLAGTVSSNPWMFAFTIFIILGWKVAGWLGLDRWLLPALGTPWKRHERPVTTVDTTTTARTV